MKFLEYLDKLTELDDSKLIAMLYFISALPFDTPKIDLELAYEKIIDECLKRKIDISTLKLKDISMRSRLNRPEIVFYLELKKDYLMKYSKYAKNYFDNLKEKERLKKEKKLRKKKSIEERIEELKYRIKRARKEETKLKYLDQLRKLEEKLKKKKKETENLHK